MRRLALMLTCGAVWLILAAVPALADGGPHAIAQNNGSLGINSDNCAGCHRAHTAQGEYLLKTADENDLCITCHGAAGTGATVNVEDGIQYAIQEAGDPDPGQRTTDTSAVAGALRGGGFLNARIDAGDGVVAGNVKRISYPRDTSSTTAGIQGPATSQSAYVPVLGTGVPTTSAHLDLIADVGGVPDGIADNGIAWGNGVAAGAGPVVTLHCASCHNPHGNGNYRILNPIPDPEPDVADAFDDASQAIYVNEVRPNPATGTYAQQTRNYTVQWGATLDDVLLGLAYPVAGEDATRGDYWRLLQPWNAVPTWDGSAASFTNPSNYYSGDMPEFIPPVGTVTTTNARTAAPASGASGVAPGQSARWRAQMTAWCSTCHTRYNTQQAGAGSVNPTTGADTRVTTTNPADDTSATLPGGFGDGRPYASGTGSYNTDSGDAIYKYRHGTQNRQCTQCHVAHGSNAAMPGTYSSDYPYPNNGLPDPNTSASSRLLKVANRGTCQACHDPTGTVDWDNVILP